MSAPEPFEPQPYQIVSDPQQLKACIEPLRIRILRILGSRAATNQQLTTLLEEPQAKVLYHLRFLLDARLIKLVDQQIKGGNVEKYYRATARLYGLRPEPNESASVSGAVFESITQEVIASATLWPDQLPSWEGRRARLSPERVREFEEKLEALTAEYWGGPDGPALEDPDAEVMALATVIYRFPGNA